MPQTSPFTVLQAVWAVLASVGLVAVGAGAAQVDGHRFLGQVFANPATTTVTLDLLVLGISVVVFVVVEASRLGMRRPWLWAVLSVPLPGAFLVPVFLVLRERRRG
ncbi:MAG: hypothetical protein JWQ32_1583 [Marmoricola sp.]|nr:hypothetical protein [Marmoricola sp.]